MSYRWIILGVLFLTRLSMAFQFQSTAALSPFLMQSYAATLADIGLLIGLYLAPGVVVALPGGALAARFGDKRIVGLSLGLMLVGGALVLFAPTWNWVIVGRVLAGIGGVIINIVMTKMLVDWFAGHEISTAMAVYITSWPVGIALALLVLPGLAETGGLHLARSGVLAVIGLGLVMFLLVYRSPAGTAATTGPVAINVTRLPVVPLMLAALIWALYNAALALVFSFGPALLIETGWTVERASSVISLFMVVFSLGAPFGGILADRTKKRDLVIAISLAAFGLMPLILVAPGMAGPILVAVGFIFAWAAGPVMTLPSVVLPPAARAFGMGVFFTVYYVVMMAAPPIAGAVADGTGATGNVIWLGTALVAVSLLCLWGFRRFAQPV